jgi:hypothetical protein
MATYIRMSRDVKLQSKVVPVLSVKAYRVVDVSVQLQTPAAFVPGKSH